MRRMQQLQQQLEDELHASVASRQPAEIKCIVLPCNLTAMLRSHCVRLHAVCALKLIFDLPSFSRVDYTHGELCDEQA